MLSLKLTSAQLIAMRLVAKNGAVFAGLGNRGFQPGRAQPVTASTILSLERLGLVKTQLSPDGGMMGVSAEQAKP